MQLPTLSFVLVAVQGLALGLAGGCARHERAPSPAPSAAAPGSAHPVRVNVPERLTSLPDGSKDALGRPARVACVTCHSQRQTVEPRAVEQLDEFHRGLRFQHGELACLSCHAPDRSDELRLASGRTLPVVEVMSLCAQCHGPQTRDYRNGSHGGMTGYWDLSRGPRQRNNCVDCHDPHSPAYPSFMPARAPRDRFFAQKPSGTEHP